jgi:hypothetical protein
MQNDIEIKQHSIQEKIETLERLGLNEELSSAMPLIADESIKDIIERTMIGAVIMLVLLTF